MTTVIFYCDNYAGMNSRIWEHFDIDTEKWLNMSKKERKKFVKKWALSKIKYWYKEIND
jgi:hypothetical protein